MNQPRHIQITAALAAAGGLAWLAKLASLAAADGADSGLVGFSTSAGSS